MTRHNRWTKKRDRLLGAALTAVLAGLALAPAAHALTPTTFSYAGPPVAIPDGFGTTGTMPGAPVSAPITVSGIGAQLVDVDLRIDGTACSTADGSPTVGIDHTLVTELEFKLTSPGGTTVLVLSRIAADGEGYNFCQVLLDDDSAAPSIQTATTAQAPFTGTWTPNAPLSAFDGQNPNGDWTLGAQDFAFADVGSIRAFSVILTTKAQPTIAGTSSPDVTIGGTVSETAVVTGRDTPVADSVDFQLYGPDDVTCSQPPVFSTTAAALDGAGNASSGGFTPTALGTYRWIASYSGDANNVASATACGASGQTVVVRAAPAPAAVPPPAVAKPPVVCRSTRRVTVRLIPRPGLMYNLRGARIVSATLTGSGGRTIRQRFTRTRATIDLRGLTRGRYTARIRIRLRSGRTVTYRPRYQVCNRGR